MDKKEEALKEYKQGEIQLGAMVIDYDFKPATIIKRIPERILMQIVAGYIQTEEDGDMASVIRKMGVLAGGYNIPIDVIDDEGELMYRIEGQVDTMNTIDGNLSDEMSDNKIHRMNLMASNNMNITPELMSLPLPKDSTFNGWKIFFARMKSIAKEKVVVKPQETAGVVTNKTNRRVVVGNTNVVVDNTNNVHNEVNDDEVDEWFD